MIIEAIFRGKYTPGDRQVPFDRAEISAHAANLNVATPKNLGDVIYSFRYRKPLPDSILNEAPDGETWIIRSVGRSRYEFVLVADLPILPNPNLALTKIPDATPGIISKYAFSDEQALLARALQPANRHFLGHHLLLVTEPPPNDRRGYRSG